ncbi:MAG: hypothetical protein H6821_17410 [Planctomycetaceae bacterium]|nr:hypothetical protein [Planctomycetaceae bacterium]
MVSNIDDAADGRVHQWREVLLEEAGSPVRIRKENAVRAIRETIRAHFERERQLHARGIKVLSPFFIDEGREVPLRRRRAVEKQNGLYAQMFEDEYQRRARRAGRSRHDRPCVADSM